jgi:hypothetical protein
MTRGAYEFCGATPGDEAVDGDAMTPLFSAIAFEAADARPNVAVLMLYGLLCCVRHQGAQHQRQQSVLYGLVTMGTEIVAV